LGLEPKIIFETADIDGIEIIIRAKELTPDVETIISKVGIEKATMQAYYNGAAVNIRLDDIIRFYRDGRDVRAQTSKNSFVIKKPLYAIEEEIVSPDFVRVSGSEIINIRYIERFSFVGGGMMRIEMKESIVAWASRRYVNLIKEHLKNASGGGVL